jgi:predicted MPP superfamily phosphohydrolase
VTPLSAAVALTFAVGQTVTAIWLVNCWLMRLRGCALKEISMALVVILWIPVALGALALGWHTPAVQGFVTLRPETAGASALLGLWLTEISFAVALCIPALWHRLRAPEIPHLNSFSTRPTEPVLRRGLPGLSVNHDALHLTELDVTLPRLPAELDGLRLLHLSDLHVEWAEALSHRALALAEELDPDLVAVTGDFIVKEVTPGLEKICARLARLEAPLGVWTIRGNHDIWHDRAAVDALLARHGLPLLDNRMVDVETDGVSLRLIGIEHPWNPMSDFHEMLNGGDQVCRIVLSHTPDNFPRLARNGADLVLSGHTHGGQWRLPVIGSLVVPSNFGRRFDQGLFESRGSLLWVTRGVGTVGLPVRLNCAPEITLLTLRSPLAAVATVPDAVEPEPALGVGVA